MKNIFFLVFIFVSSFAMAKKSSFKNFDSNYDPLRKGFKMAIIVDDYRDSFRITVPRVPKKSAISKYFQDPKFKKYNSWKEYEYLMKDDDFYFNVKRGGNAKGKIDYPSNEKEDWKKKHAFTSLDSSFDGKKGHWMIYVDLSKEQPEKETTYTEFLSPKNKMPWPSFTFTTGSNVLMLDHSKKDASKCRVSLSRRGKAIPMSDVKQTTRNATKKQYYYRKIKVICSNMKLVEDLESGQKTKMIKKVAFVTDYLEGLQLNEN